MTNRFGSATQAWGLAGLYATGTRKVPAGAPVGFVPTKWAGYNDHYRIAVHPDIPFALRLSD